MIYLESLLGSIFAVLLIGMVLRDLTRVRLILASMVAIYSVLVTWSAYRGIFLPSAESLPPLSLVAGQCLMLVLIASTLMTSTRAWRQIPLAAILRWHAVRFPIGLVMVLWAQSGLLAKEFGWGAGSGEVLVGFWALIYLLVPGLRSATSLAVWCAVGLLDVLVGMTTAVLTFRSPFQHFAHAGQMTVLSSPPLLLVPSFSMAVLTVSTFLLFLRRNEFAVTAPGGG